MIRVKFQQVKTNKVSGLGHCWSGKLKQNQSESLGDFFDNKYSVLRVGIRFGFFSPFLIELCIFFIVHMFLSDAKKKKKCTQIQA